MKHKLKYLIATVLLVSFTLFGAVSASANEESYSSEGSSNEASDENFFSQIYEEVSLYASEILCALTLAGSVMLAIAYKKGLLPLVERSLIAISNAVTKIKETTKTSSEKSDALSQSLDTAIKDTEKALGIIASKLCMLEGAVNEELKSKSEARLEVNRLQTVIGAQIDMLYDVFMSSALPQYQKDAVGERIAKMREAMAENAEA